MGREGNEKQGCRMVVLPEFENFEVMLRKLLKVPHSKIKAKLDAEKKAKKHKKEKHDNKNRHDD